MKKTIKTTTIALAALVLGLTFTSCKKNETKPDEPTPTPAPVYANFKITSVKITSMPFTDANGAGWDLTDGPDVFFNIETAAGSVLFDGSASKSNNLLSSDLPLSWNFTTAYQITNTSVTNWVTIYDYDTLDPNDEIGFVGFKMDDHKSGYPTTISKSSGSLSVTINGVWY